MEPSTSTSEQGDPPAQPQASTSFLSRPDGRRCLKAMAISATVLVALGLVAVVVWAVVDLTQAEDDDAKATGVNRDGTHDTDCNSDRNLCKNGGTCLEKDSGIGYECLCPPGVGGYTCSIKGIQNSSENLGGGNYILHGKSLLNIDTFWSKCHELGTGRPGSSTRGHLAFIKTQKEYDFLLQFLEKSITNVTDREAVVGAWEGQVKGTGSTQISKYEEGKWQFYIGDDFYLLPWAAWSIDQPVKNNIRNCVHLWNKGNLKGMRSGNCSLTGFPPKERYKRFVCEEPRVAIPPKLSSTSTPKCGQKLQLVCYRVPIYSNGSAQATLPVLYEGLGFPATHMRFYKNGDPLLPESDPATGWRRLEGAKLADQNNVTFTLPALGSKENGVYTCKSALSNTGRLRSADSEDKIIIVGCADPEQSTTIGPSTPSTTAPPGPVPIPYDGNCTRGGANECVSPLSCVDDGQGLNNTVCGCSGTHVYDGLNCQPAPVPAPTGIAYNKPCSPGGPGCLPSLSCVNVQGRYVCGCVSPLKYSSLGSACLQQQKSEHEDDDNTKTALIILIAVPGVLLVGIVAACMTAAYCWWQRKKERDAGPGRWDNNYTQPDNPYGSEYEPASTEEAEEEDQPSQEAESEARKSDQIQKKKASVAQGIYSVLLGKTADADDENEAGRSPAASKSTIMSSGRGSHVDTGGSVQRSRAGSVAKRN